MRQRIKGLTGGLHEVEAATLEALAASLDGSLLYPGDEGFAQATSLWNGMIKKQPAVRGSGRVNAGHGANRRLRP